MNTTLNYPFKLLEVSNYLPEALFQLLALVTRVGDLKLKDVAILMFYRGHRAKSFR